MKFDVDRCFKIVKVFYNFSPGKKRLCFEELCNVNVTLVIFSVVRVDVWVCVEKENALYPYHLKVCAFIAHGKEKVGISPNYNFQKLN